MHGQGYTAYSTQPVAQQATQNGWSNGYSQSNENVSGGGGNFNGFAQSTPSSTVLGHQNGYAIPIPMQAGQNIPIAAPPHFYPAIQQNGFVAPPYFHPQQPPPQQISMNYEQQNGAGGFNSHSPYNGSLSQGSWNSQPVGNERTEQTLFHGMNSGINFDNYENIPVSVTGENTLEAIENFGDADLHPWIQENIARSGYNKPTPVQKNSIPTLIANRDLMSCAQTGSGKTAAFLLPIINHILKNGPEGIKQPSINGSGRRTYYPAALVLSPTRELAIQIHKEASKFSYRTNIQTAILYGGRENYRDQVNRLRVGVHILIATPGRLIDIIDQGYIGLQGCRFFVLDEADRMLDMGFEPQIRKIVGLGLPQKENRTTAMFSATFPKEIQILAKDFLKSDYVFLAVGRVGSTAENIDQRFMWVEEPEKRRKLIEILMTEDPANLCLIFVETKKGANELAYYLGRSQVQAVAIHGDLKQLDRERNLDLFRSGQYPVLVATAVAARGLDIPNVRHVINFDLPNDSDEYVHRIGRTGRCGNVGTSTSFFNDKNRGIGRDLMNLLQEANQEVPDWLRRVAAEGRLNGNSRQGNRRFGGVDYRRSNNSGFGNQYSAQNGFVPNQQASFGNGFNSNIHGGPRRPFPSNSGFGAHNGLANGFGGGNRSGGRGGFSNGMGRGGYTNGFVSNGNGFSANANAFVPNSARFNNYSNGSANQNNGGNIDHWQPPQ